MAITCIAALPGFSLHSRRIAPCGRKGGLPTADDDLSEMALPLASERFGSRAGASSGAVVRQHAIAGRRAVATALIWLFLLVIAIQGFHVIEHIALVVQVQALGLGLDEAHGLLGARVDFEWLHFSYNLSFLATLALLLVYGRRWRATPSTPPNAAILALAGAVGLQTYHMVEHTIRIVQYYQTDCNPCVGLIGQVVPFIWPHLFFGLFAYLPLVAAYFAFGLHGQLKLPSLPRSGTAPA